MIRSAFVAVIAASPLAAQDDWWPVPRDQWEQMDLEARWVAYKNGKREAPKWFEFLARRRAFDVLEYIVLYEYTDVNGRNTAFAKLKEADAPQWIRCAHWRLRHADSHTMEASNKDLDNQAAYSWLKRYPTAREVANAQQLFKQLEAKFARALDVARYLPPLDPAEVLLPYLDAPPGMPEFGDRLSAERGVRYRHQVLRAIEGVRALKNKDLITRTKLRSLTRHSDARVRIEAYGAFTTVAPLDIPYLEFLAVANDTDQSAKVRRWALMAASYHPHPAVRFALLDIALDRGHAAGDAAISRLGDIGDQFEAIELHRAAEAGLEAASGAESKILDRFRKWQKGHYRGAIERWVDQVAWLRAVEHPAQARHRRWAFETIWKNATADDIRKLVGPERVDARVYGKDTARMKTLVADELGKLLEQRERE